MAALDALDEDEEGGIVINEDIDKLRQAWIEESTCPEILGFKRDLVEEMTKLMKEQEEILEEAERSGEQLFTATLYEMDIERIKFTLAKYLRTRLIKIEKYAWKIAEDEDMREFLSFDELTFVDAYQDSLKKHFHETILKGMPVPFQTFPDPARSVNVDTYSPSLDTYLFLKVPPAPSQTALELAGEYVEVSPEDVLVARYLEVREHLPEGESKIFDLI